MSRGRVCGFHVVETLARESPHRILEVFIDKSRQDRRLQRLIDALDRQGLPHHLTARDRLDLLAGHPRHQGVVAEVMSAPVLDDAHLFDLVRGRTDLLVCVLENVQDPRNLGACLRTAEGAGVDAVILPRQGSCGLTPVVRGAAAGAAELVTVARVSNVARVLERLKQEAGLWVVGTDADARQSLYDIPLSGSVAMVFGSEGTGLKRLTRESCDHLVSIPMQGRVGSLNVSVAVGVGLFEVVRRRRSPGAAPTK